MFAGRAPTCAQSRNAVKSESIEDILHVIESSLLRGTLDSADPPIIELQKAGVGPYSDASAGDRYIQARIDTARRIHHPPSTR
jgi:hypothetical protein